MISSFAVASENLTIIDLGRATESSGLGPSDWCAFLILMSISGDSFHVSQSSPFTNPIEQLPSLPSGIWNILKLFRLSLFWRSSHFAERSISRWIRYRNAVWCHMTVSSTALVLSSIYPMFYLHVCHLIFYICDRLLQFSKGHFSLVMPVVSWRSFFNSSNSISFDWLSLLAEVSKLMLAGLNDLFLFFLATFVEGSLSFIRSHCVTCGFTISEHLLPITFRLVELCFYAAMPSVTPLEVNRAFFFIKYLRYRAIS